MAVDKVLAVQTRGPEFGGLHLEPQHQHTKNQVELMPIALALWLWASRASQSSTVAELNRLNRARLMKSLDVSVWLCVHMNKNVERSEGENQGCPHLDHAACMASGLCDVQSASQ